MADEEEAQAPVGNEKLYQHVGEIIFIIFGLLLLARFLPAIMTVVANRGFGTGSAGLDAFLNSFYYGLQTFFLWFTVVSNVLSVFLLMGIIYATIRLNELSKIQDEMIKPPIASGSGAAENKQWLEIGERINSDNPSDWRLAIIEADIILDDLLNKIGCVGLTVADKLKQVEKADFATLDNAWEAHKVRNSVAHEGQEFLLSKREAQRVIRLYESVFKEFHYI